MNQDIEATLIAIETIILDPSMPLSKAKLVRTRSMIGKVIALADSAHAAAFHKARNLLEEIRSGLNSANRRRSPLVARAIGTPRSRQSGEVISDLFSNVELKNRLKIVDQKLIERMLASPKTPANKKYPP